VFVGKTGDDSYGAALRDSLESAGVSLECVGEDAGGSTGVALILVDDEGNNSIAVIPGANGRVSRRDVDCLRPPPGPADVVVFQLEIPVDTVEYAARVAHEAGARVILNPAPTQQLSPRLLECCDVIVPNRGELQGLSGSAEPAVAARVLLKAGVRAVVVTLGEEGILIVTTESEIAMPALPARAVDTTGAGDAFVGNLAHCLSRNQSLEDAGRFAAAAAALSVQRPGAQPSMPTGEETERFLEAQTR
jgi:ribokinase